MSLTALDLTVLFAYLGALSLIGIYFSRRQTSRAEYFLGGRKVYWFLAGGSVLATILSTISYLSVPGEVIRYGFAYCLGLLVTPLIIPVLNRVLIPVITRLPITSAYEYLERRFSPGISRMASTVFILRALIWIGIIIYTASFAFSSISGWSIFSTISLIGLVTTFYTTAGGFRTVIWTDNLQLWVLFGGALAVPLYVATATGSGPLGWWEVLSEAEASRIEVFSWDPTARITVIGVMLHVFFWNICANGGDQVALQRYLSTPSVRAARRSVWVYAWSNVILYSTLAVCGLALFAFYQQQSGLPADDFQRRIALEADEMMPRFIVGVLPTGISGLLMAAILAAAMSSLSSGINSIAGVLTSHYFRGRNEAGEVRRDRLVAVAAGLAGTLMAFTITLVMQRTAWNILDLSGRVNDLFVGPLAVLFFGGILLRRAAATSALGGFLVGVAVSVFISFSREWLGMEREVSWMWTIPVSFTVGLAAVALLSRWLPAPRAAELEGLTMGRRSREEGD